MRNARLVACAVALASVAVGRPCLAEGEPDPLGMRPLPAYRFAITPSWTHSFVARSVSFEAVGLTLQTYIGKTSRFGVGLAGAIYSPFSESRAPGLAFPRANETRWSLLTEFTWVALRSHRAELGVLGGFGAISTRPVSLVDPSHRTFSYGTHLAFSSGAVARAYITREMALSIEGRNVVYVDQLESAEVSVRHPEDPTSWYGEKPLTQAFEARIGLTVLLSARDAR